MEEYIMELFEHWHSVGVGGVKPSASGVDTLKKVFLIIVITVIWPNT